MARKTVYAAEAPQQPIKPKQTPMNRSCSVTGRPSMSSGLPVCSPKSADGLAMRTTPARATMPAPASTRRYCSPKNRADRRPIRGISTAREVQDLRTCSERREEGDTDRIGHRQRRKRRVQSKDAKEQCANELASTRRAKCTHSNRATND